MRSRNPGSILRAFLSVTLTLVIVPGWSVVDAAQNTSRLRVRLTAPISSEGTAGSRVAGQVVTPAHLAGAILEGRITNAKGSGGLRASSELGFKFETLYHQGKQYPIDGQVIGYYNSKGLQNTDDEGHIIKNSNKAITTTVVAAGIGAAIGAIVSGGKNDTKSTKNAKNTKNTKNDDSEKNNRLRGAAAGAAVGAASGLALGLTTNAPRIMFDTGSEFELDVKAQEPSRAR